MRNRKLTCFQCKYSSRKHEEFVHIIPSHKYRCKDMVDCKRRQRRYVI